MSPTPGDSADRPVDSPLLTKLRRRARATTRQAGRLSSSARMTPDFLIVGAQRCGTTSMFKTLSQHPAVLPAVLHKGVHYFDKHYGRGMAWYRGHFPLQASAWRAERRTGTRPVTGESSPYYMFHPLAGQRIASDLPGVRLVVLLRDPVERAYSAYTHERARGYESETFERALELEPARVAGEYDRFVADPFYDSHHLQHNAYLTRGQYVEQLERLERLVGRERIHAVDSQQFFTDPSPVYAEVLDFLGLPPYPETHFDRHNARHRSALSPDLRERLDAHFQPYDERLARWLGETPGWRR